jgi:hypothetical protein
MPIWNKISAALAVSALFAAPAFADGTPGQHVNRGPAPLQAQAPVPPREGCILIENGRAWQCPAPVQNTTHRQASGTTHYGHRTADHRTTTSHSQHASHAHNHGHNHGHSGHAASHGANHGHTHGAVTQTTRSAPTHTRRVVSTRSVPATTTRRTVSSTTTRPAAVDTGVKLDIASFSGGVGNGVEGGFYGGGGAIFIGGDKRFSGVLQSRASQFTFQNRRRSGKKRGGHHGGHHGGGGGCGC